MVEEVRLQSSSLDDELSFGVEARKLAQDEKVKLFVDLDPKGYPINQPISVQIIPDGPYFAVYHYQKTIEHQNYEEGLSEEAIAKLPETEVINQPHHQKITHYHKREEKLPDDEEKLPETEVKNLTIGGHDSQTLGGAIHNLLETFNYNSTRDEGLRRSIQRVAESEHIKSIVTEGIEKYNFRKE
ncbi:MAG: hypothetical protein V3V78_03990 [Candidatus Woesearchaeota archaeon]